MCRVTELRKWATRLEDGTGEGCARRSRDPHLVDGSSHPPRPQRDVGEWAVLRRPRPLRLPRSLPRTPAIRRGADDDRFEGSFITRLKRSFFD
jgi:hypothetical protein